LLLLDGHSSHFELKSIELAKKEGVIIIKYLYCLSIKGVLYIPHFLNLEIKLVGVKDCDHTFANKGVVGIYVWCGKANKIQCYPSSTEQHDISMTHQVQSVSTPHPHQSVFKSHLQQSLPYRSQIDTLSDEQAEQLSNDMTEKFMRQYENGYNLYDPEMASDQPSCVNHS